VKFEIRHSAFGIEDSKRSIMNYIFIASSYSWIFDLGLYTNLFISNPCIIPLNLVLINELITGLASPEPNSTITVELSFI